MIAAQKLINGLNVDINEIKVLLYVTAYTDFLIPSTSMYLKNKLRLVNDCICFDINLGCSSFINGAYIISIYLQKMNIGDKGLLIISDTVNYGGEKLEKSTAMLSSDCACACMFENTGSVNKWMYQQRFDGTRYEALLRKDIRHNLNMDGMAVFQFAITDVSEDLKTFMNKLEIQNDDYDYCIIHQAQKFIIDKVILFSGLEKQKSLNSYNICGNTGGSSIITTMCCNRDKLIEQDRVKFLVSGFGSGMSWGFIFFEMYTKGIMNVIYSDDCFEDE